MLLFFAVIYTFINFKLTLYEVLKAPATSKHCSK
jgi:hypothetical protein